MPAEKDAFAELFLSATGTSRPLSLNSSLNNLSLRDQKPKLQSVHAWSNLDILSPANGLSPHGSASTTPKPQKPATEFDPFSIFDSKPSVLDASSFNSSKSTVGQPTSTTRQHTNSNRGIGEISLLDDDFTDAFETVALQSAPEQARRPPAGSINHSVAPTPKRSSSVTPPTRSASTDAMDKRDTVLAGLMDIGFPIDVANQTIDEVGPDLQTCVNFIMSGGQSRDFATLLKNKHSKNQSSSEMGASLQYLSADILKKASWFLDKSKKTVIKNINQFQQSQIRDNDKPMPIWMKNQQKYKGGAMERKGNSEMFEDYGEDEDNIDSEEIQRIMHLQKQREKERQRERLENLRKSSSNKSSRQFPQNASRGPSTQVYSALGRNSPALAPKLPKRPSLTSINGSSRFAKAQPSPSPSPSHSSSSSFSSAPAMEKVQQNRVEPEVDLLGLGASQPLSRAEIFKQSSSESEPYVSPSRRRPAKVAKKDRIATAEALNAFQQSDFETFKAKATTSFTQGNYGDALSAYTRCLEALPPKHELRIVIFSNLAITHIKLGNYKTAKEQCEEGIALVGDNIDDADWLINDRVIKYWYVKLLTRKAESLEMLENFPESLEYYLELVTKHGVTDKKVMDAKRRVNNIVNPPKSKPKAQPKRATVNAPATNTEQLQKIRKQHNSEKIQEEMRFKLHDQVHEKVVAWTNGKEDNLRSLLMSLDEVIPARLGFPFLQKKITISDLMLTKKVKINYMKVISSIHPDKLSKFDLEDQMICQAVFVALNKAWDSFKEQCGLN